MDLTTCAIGQDGWKDWRADEMWVECGMNVVGLQRFGPNSFCLTCFGIMANATEAEPVPWGFSRDASC